LPATIPFPLILLLILVQVSATASGDLMVAHGMRQRPPRLPWVIVGTAVLATGFGIFAMLLHWVPLSVMAPAGAGSYLLVTLLSRLILKEQISTLRWTGTLLLATGVLLVILTNKPD
jgi:drug/metabolite transporter (DMT)-like permease